MRMTTRRWMVGVAVVGIVMGGAISFVRLKRRHDSFLFLAQFHGEREQYWRREEPEMIESIRLAERVAKQAEDRQQSRDDSQSEAECLKAGVAERRRIAAHVARLIAYNATLARKYELAAAYPWLPVEPDPPEPR